jgi:hypothetical protein
MSLRRIGVTLLLAGASTWSACAIYDNSLLLPESAAFDGGDLEAGAADGGVDGGHDDAGCQLFGAPPPPTTNDGKENLDVTFAMAAFRLVPNGTASVNHPKAPVAMDLDRRCTCPGPPSCTSPAAKPDCDSDGGGDDATGDMWATFASLAPSQFNDDSLNAGLRLGYNGLLIRMRGYNGGKNDTQVTLIAYESPGTPGVEMKTPTLPKYDGTDVWTVSPASLVGGTGVDAGAGCEGNDTACLPLAFDTNAYVSNGVVVGHVNIPVTAGGVSAKLRVSLTDVVVVAPLIFDGKSYRVDEGQFAGRWEASAFLSSLQSVPDPLDGTQGLCGMSPTYINVKSMACSKRDIVSDPSKDNMGTPCDALSVTVSFSAVQAHLGPIAQGAPLSQRCGAGWSDSCP